MPAGHVILTILGFLTVQAGDEKKTKINFVFVDYFDVLLNEAAMVAGKTALRRVLKQ